MRVHEKEQKDKEAEEDNSKKLRRKKNERIYGLKEFFRRRYNVGFVSVEKKQAKNIFVMTKRLA